MKFWPTLRKYFNLGLVKELTIGHRLIKLILCSLITDTVVSSFIIWTIRVCIKQLRLKIQDMSGDALTWVELKKVSKIRLKLNPQLMQPHLCFSVGDLFIKLIN